MHKIEFTYGPTIYPFVHNGQLVLSMEVPYLYDGSVMTMDCDITATKEQAKQLLVVIEEFLHE